MSSQQVTAVTIKNMSAVMKSNQVRRQYWKFVNKTGILSMSSFTCNILRSIKGTVSPSSGSESADHIAIQCNGSNKKEKLQKLTSELLGHKTRGHLLEQAYCDCIRHFSFPRSQRTLIPDVLVISLRDFWFGIQNKVNCKSTSVDAAERNSRTCI